MQLCCCCVSHTWHVLWSVIHIACLEFWKIFFYMGGSINLWLCPWLSMSEGNSSVFLHVCQVVTGDKQKVAKPFYRLLIPKKSISSVHFWHTWLSFWPALFINICMEGNGNPLPIYSPLPIVTYHLSRSECNMSVSSCTWVASVKMKIYK